MWSVISHLVAVLIAFGLQAPEGPQPRTGPSQAVEFVDMPAEFTELALWALGLFDEAALDLPPIRFVYHGDDTSPCAGRLGVHRHVDGRSTVELCTSDPGSTTGFLVLHETAHAWAAHDLDDDRRAAFQALRGWTHWSNHDAVDWHENGSEQAAEIMVWGLIDRPVGIARIHDHSCEALDAGYRTLTGQPPLHGHRNHC